MNREYPGGLKTAILEGRVAPKLKLTIDSVRQMKQNPYSSKAKWITLCYVIILALAISAIILSSRGILPRLSAFLIGGSGIIMTSMAVDIGSTYVRYSNFRKLKKIYNSPEYKEKFESLTDAEWDHLKDMWRLVAQASDSRMPF